MAWASRDARVYVYALATSLIARVHPADTTVVVGSWPSRFAVKASRGFAHVVTADANGNDLRVTTLDPRCAPQ